MPPNDQGASIKDLVSAKQTDVLDCIDILRGLGLSTFIELPQIIVCGDQSSGKSSLLAAVSGVPFPRNENLCTRFATEVVLRRAETETIVLSVVPSKDCDASERQELEHFKKELTSVNELEEALVAANEAMGLLAPGAPSFSNHILKIEVSGPNQIQLTVVDLPGIIQSHTKSQTEKDVALVNNLVTEYMKSRRSIILAVVSAKNDIGNQAILDKARKIDPEGSRTLGVITKPDSPRDGSQNQQAFLELARNENVWVALGWHVVRNLDSSNNEEVTLSRDEVESMFFQSSKFGALPEDCCGVASLRTRLAEILFEHIVKTLPSVCKDLAKKMKETSDELDKLGEDRSTLAKQIHLLIKKSQKFQQICSDASRGQYTDEFFKKYGSKANLRAKLVDILTRFGQEMHQKGQKWELVEQPTDQKTQMSRSQAITHASNIMKEMKGQELAGLSNPVIVGILFNLYSEPWGTIAQKYVESIHAEVLTFCSKLLAHLFDGEMSSQILTFHLKPKLAVQNQKAHKQLHRLLQSEKRPPLTLNHYFTSNRQKKKTKVEDLETKLRESYGPNHSISVATVFSMIAQMKDKDEPNMDRVAAEEALDNTLAYYKVALKTFIDNVARLVIEANLVDRVDQIFSPEAVSSMDEKVISQLAGESLKQTNRRISLAKRQESFEHAQTILKRYGITHDSGDLRSDKTPDSQTGIASVRDDDVENKGGSMPPVFRFGQSRQEGGQKLS